MPRTRTSRLVHGFPHRPDDLGYLAVARRIGDLVHADLKGRAAMPARNRRVRRATS